MDVCPDDIRGERVSSSGESNSSGVGCVGGPDENGKREGDWPIEEGVALSWARPTRPSGCVGAASRDTVVPTTEPPGIEEYQSAKNKELV
jgi:hypothetical protein